MLSGLCSKPQITATLWRSHLLSPICLARLTVGECRWLSHPASFMLVVFKYLFIFQKIDLNEMRDKCIIVDMPKPGDLITKAKAFQPSEVTYKPPLINKRGGKSVQLQLRSQPLVLQIPLMLTWGVNERVDEQSGRVSYDLALQFEKGKSSSGDRFQDALQTLQEKVLDDAVTNSKSWFGKSSQSREVLKALMYPILKYPKKKDDSGDIDYERDPTLKLKIPFWEGKFNVELYSMEGKACYLPPKNPDAACSHGVTRQRDCLTCCPQGTRTPMDIVPKATHLNGLIACTGLWMAGGRFGVTWKLLQACVCPPVHLLGSGTCHVSYDSDDERAVANLGKREEQPPAEPEPAGPTFSDSDTDGDEADGEDEEKPPTPPPAPKKKKVVRRRKKKE